MRYFKAYCDSSIYRSVAVPYLRPNHFQGVVSPPAELHKSAVKVAHTFWCCVCVSTHQVAPLLLLVFLVELWCQLTKKRRKQRNTSYLSHNSRFLMWMCTNGLPKQPLGYFFDKFHLLLLYMDTPCGKSGERPVPAGCAWSFVMQNMTRA